MPEDRTTDELVKLAMEIRRRVSERVREAMRQSAGDKDPSGVPAGSGEAACRELPW